LTTQIGANVDTPEIFFAENIGVSVASLEQVMLSYNNLGVSGLPFVMNIEVSGDLVATMNLSPDYMGGGFSLTYRGLKYCGTFDSGTVSF
jgi:hypothetical protein